MQLDNTQMIFELLKTSNRVERRLDHSLSCVCGISFTEYCLLKQLGELHQGAATRVNLAAAVHLTPSAVTRALKPLEKIGYVTSHKSDRDARQSLASLTKAGKKMLNNAHRLVSDEIESLNISARDSTKLMAALELLSF